MKKSLFVLVLVSAVMAFGALAGHAQQDPANVGTPPSSRFRASP